MSTIQIARTDADITRCFPVMHQLRPHLVAEKFVARIRLQETESYRLAFLCDDAAIVRAVAGFRVRHMLSAGRSCYVDDLITDAATRSHGYGRDLLTWLKNWARENSCEHFALDSGTHRKDAHRFYLRERLDITCFHFSQTLGPPV